MAQDELHRALAVLLLICVSIIFVIDVGAEMGNRRALRYKWGLVWVIVRYVGIISAVLLALDVLLS